MLGKETALTVPVLLGSAVPARAIPFQPAQELALLRSWILANRLLEIMTQEADLRVLRGWLALEAGNLDQARESLKQAIQVGASGKQVLNFGGRPLAEMGLEWLDRKR